MMEYKLLTNKFGDKRICVLLDDTEDIEKAYEDAVVNDNNAGSAIAMHMGSGDIQWLLGAQPGVMGAMIKHE